MPSRDEIDLSASTVTVDLDPDRNESEQGADKVILTARRGENGEIVFDGQAGKNHTEGRECSSHAVTRYLGRRGGKVVEVSGPPVRETT